MSRSSRDVSTRLDGSRPLSSLGVAPLEPGGETPYAVHPAGSLFILSAQSLQLVRSTMFAGPSSGYTRTRSR